MMLLAVDIEVFPDFHSFTAKDVATGDTFVFVLHSSSGRDDRIAYLAFLKMPQTWITFNGLSYDYPVVHQILLNKSFFASAPLSQVNNRIYEWSCEIIQGIRPKPFGNQSFIQQFDLFKIWHFDNKARSASLKHVEFFLRWPDLRDMPIDPHKAIGNDSLVVKDVLDYNLNDVKATLEFWEYTKKDGRIDLRSKIINTYGIAVTNLSDVSIGSELLAKFLSEDMQIDVQDLKKLRTIRRKVNVLDCIPNLSFKTAPFIKIHESFKRAVVKSTKSAFDNIDISPLFGDVQFKNGTYVVNKKSSKGLKCHNFGIELKYGMGGLHAAARPGIYESDDEYTIIDVDVTSYYPNMAINYNYKPEHLGDSFARIYKWMFEERNRIPKKDPINKALKLSLNGSFGRMGSPDSFLFDLKALLSITVTGQLLLSKLIEDIYLAINDIEIIQVNTDGVTFRVKRNLIDKLKEVCKSWEDFTNLKLEYAYYDKMAMRDVNNYCALSKDYVKAKGDFEIEKEAHKNHSQRIVSIASVLHLLADIPIEDIIFNHLSQTEYTQLKTDTGTIKCHAIFDFAKEVRSKGEGKKGKAKLFLKNMVSQKSVALQKINRYYISNDSKDKLIKVYSDGSHQLIEANVKGTCKIINKITDLTPPDVNYDYYISEARKLITSVKGNGQLSLFE